MRSTGKLPSVLLNIRWFAGSKLLLCWFEAPALAGSKLLLRIRYCFTATLNSAGFGAWMPSIAN